MNISILLFTLYLVATSIPNQDVWTTPPVEAEYDGGYDFTQLDSYAWTRDLERASNEADHIRIVKAISERLKALGFTRDDKNPDVRVSYALATEQKKLHVDSRQSPSEWDPTDLETTLALGRHEESYLVVEMFDSATGERIWWARCAHPQPAPDRVEKSLDETLGHLFASYPEKSESSK